MNYENYMSVADEIEEHVTELQQAMSIAILNRVVLGTPVGNPDLWVYNNGSKESPNYVDFTYARGEIDYVGGRARANWQVSFNTVLADEIDNIDASGRGTISAGNAEISKVVSYGKLYIQNNLPYIEPLNQGSSTQAPAFFIETAIDSVVGMAGSL